MLNDIYNQKIIELAGNIPRLGRLPDPDASATAHSKLCGSTVKIDLKMQDGVVSDFAKYPEWRSGVTSVEVQGPVGVGAVVTEHGPEGTIPYRIEVFEPPSKIVMRIADTSLSFGGTWTFEVFPNDSGSELVITENGEVYNPIFRFMSKFLFSPSATIETYLADLKKKLGES